MERMKIFVHGNKNEGSVYTMTLCTLAALSLLMFSFTALINSQYQKVSRQYESFYQGDEVYEID